ncbi:MAG: APC family permease [Candidatus Saccharimonadales bacterium]
MPKNKLQKSLGLFTLCVIGVAGTVGGGIFVLLSPGAAVAGDYLPLSFILGGLLAFMGALLYAELGTTIPRSGSSIELVFSTTRKRYYPFIFSWLVLLGDVSYLVINALGLAFYMNFFIAVNPILIALSGLALVGLINLKGTSSTGKGEILTGVSLVILLFIFVAMALMGANTYAPREFISQVPTNLLPIIAGTSVVFTAFVGYEYISSVAEEAKDAAKNIPRALMITVAIATVTFSLVSYAALKLVSPDSLAAADAPLLLAAEGLGTVGTWIVLPAAIMATAGSLLAATLVSSRRLYALSRQGYMRSVFSKVNQFDVPHRSILGVLVLAVFLLLTNSVAFIAYIGNTVYLVVLITIALSLLKFRRQRPYLNRPFKAPLFPWMPITVMVLAGSILLFVDKISIAVTALWLVLGYFVYLATRISQHKLYYGMWGGVVFLLLVGLLGLLYLF